ncbi:MAG: class I SAM-dependent methyltransferase [Candidatus Eremiobacteraeota bacterium]|nr:class I SAM-dependent methyltransferase [Candidatus Eremiobacteraeota bacterium]
MFTLSAKYYDALYRAMGKDYQKEAACLTEILRGRGVQKDASLLDVACGTGGHLEYLRNEFTCEGLDLDRNMLNIAAARCPEIPLAQADMINFNLGKKYDVITCMFSSIGYVPNTVRLEQTLQTFARHLKPGGIVIFEPWHTPDQWKDAYLNALYVDEPALKVARMNVSRRDGNVSIIHFHYMIGSSDGIRTFTEPHRLTLFTHEEYRNALQRARFDVAFEQPGLMNRGLYIGAL